jgi:hypothetical protein
MPQITIQGTVIDYPDSAESPNWAPALIQFAQAVEDALTGVVGDFDISPQTFTIDTATTGSAINVPNLAFSTDQVRGSFIRYTVYRTTSTTTVAESGNMEVVYNDDASIGSKWSLSREANGDGQVAFTITDTGQVQVNITALGGINHTGQINYTAQAIEQEY